MKYAEQEYCCELTGVHYESTHFFLFFLNPKSPAYHRYTCTCMCKISSVIEIQVLQQENQSHMNNLNSHSLIELRPWFKIFAFCNVPCVALKWCEETI